MGPLTAPNHSPLSDNRLISWGGVLIFFIYFYLIKTNYGGNQKWNYTNFMNKKGFGNCKKISRTFGYKPSCYVLQPSNCDDIRNSSANLGKQMSASACKGKGGKDFFTNRSTIIYIWDVLNMPKINLG